MGAVGCPMLARQEVYQGRLVEVPLLALGGTQAGWVALAWRGSLAVAMVVWAVPGVMGWPDLAPEGAPGRAEPGRERTWGEETRRRPKEAVELQREC